MKRQPLLLAATAALAIAAVAGFQLTTSSPAYSQTRPKAQTPPKVQTSQTKKSFREDIVPIFKGRCESCHQPGGEGVEKSGLDLTSYAGVMKGTKFGPMVIARDPQSSNLMWLLDWRASPALRMPHGMKKLSVCDRDAIRGWIRQGAKNN